MRVVQILYSGLGGHASVAFSLLDGDSDRQWKSSMLFVGVELLAPAYLQQCVERRVSIKYVKSSQGRPWRAWAAVFSALLWLRPDAVVLHSVSSLLPVALYCLTHGTRLIAVEHTSIALKSRAERAMSGLALRLARSIVVLTDTYRNEHLASFRWFRKHSKVVVIPNGIDVASFSVAAPRPPDGTVRIGMAARFSSTKRQDLLVSALPLLEQRHPEVRWRLSLAGDGDCHARVQAQVDRLGLVDRVELKGNLGPAELISWFQSLDLYAHASEGEALSTSMLQAMAMGLPMLASDVPGITNLLQDAATPLGLLIRGNTPAAFATGIGTLHFDPRLQARLASAARARVVDSYNHETMFKSYNSLIQGARN